ncbi:predicted protein [Histoplasma capsulatum G186AR]|uniref:Uncharacterized protein n=1 Tax=Ajellomyces capsulatus (strain G186AR / H82 / ATCC MYA-2454 / RMSCC 2432) TaxID=447093 RepID=C0NMC1_AJECG|nr:uncharacterized protein HCBG_04651 [Histoplasma capsulatum G186AR]EEH07772.1 predicted protein [Histoplasma capsulatum G186AR]
MFHSRDFGIATPCLLSIIFGIKGFQRMHGNTNCDRYAYLGSSQPIISPAHTSACRDWIMDPAEGRSEGPQPPMARSTSPRSRGTQRDFCMDVDMCIPAASAKDKDMTLFHHSSITVPSQSHSRTPFPFWVFVSLVAGGKYYLSGRH